MNNSQGYPKNLLITGRPGVGKTTCVIKVINLLKEKKIVVGGMISREVREEGRRTGFKVMDVLTGEEGYLARADVKGQPRVGRYKVELEDFERIGIKAIRRGLEEAQVIAIDEIGPMELYSESFKEIVKEAFNSNKVVLATIHYKAYTNPYCRALLSRGDVKRILLTLENREKAPAEIFSLITKRIRG